MTAVFIMSLIVIGLTLFILIPFPIKVTLHYLVGNKPEIRLYLYDFIPLNIQMDFSGRIEIDLFKVLIIDSIGIGLCFDPVRSFGAFKAWASLEALMSSILPILGIKPSFGLRLNNEKKTEISSEIKLKVRIDRLIKELLWKRQAE